jgi:hypothetical protein
VTEAKYIEVIWLLWLWPEGRALIQDAAANGVTILTMRPGTLARLTVAVYAPSLNAIGVNPSHNEVSTWMLASTIVHELKHSSDDLNGLFTERTRANCVTREQRAFAVERRYALWISAWQGGFPSESQVASRLSSDDYQAFMNIMAVVSAPNLDVYVDQLYRTRCAA